MRLRVERNLDPFEKRSALGAFPQAQTKPPILDPNCRGCLRAAKAVLRDVSGARAAAFVLQDKLTLPLGHHREPWGAADAVLTF